MTRLVALTRRELMAYFYAPVPYLVMFLFLLMTAWIFWSAVGTGPKAPITYQPVLQWLAFALLFLMPLLTMNTVAEERSRNTLETLLTAPVADWQVIAAKWFATFVFYLVMLVPTLVYWPVLEHFAVSGGLLGPDPGPILAGYLGALLIGGLYIAIGIFASSLTENSLLSAFLAFFTAIALMITSLFLGDETGDSPMLAKIGEYMTPQAHLNEMLKGKVDLYNVIYFVSVSLFFLFLAVRSLESRKWR